MISREDNVVLFELTGIEKREIEGFMKFLQVDGIKEFKAALENELVLNPPVAHTKERRRGSEKEESRTKGNLSMRASFRSDEDFG